VIILGCWPLINCSKDKIAKDAVKAASSKLKTAAKKATEAVSKKATESMAKSGAKKTAAPTEETFKPEVLDEEAMEAEIMAEREEKDKLNA
jgi:hypothetical protein